MRATFFCVSLPKRARGSKGVSARVIRQRQFCLERHESCDVLFVLLAACLAYLPAAVQGGWFSDDYVLVYGLEDQAPAWTDSIRMGGAGRLSVARLLCYPFIGYLGEWLGPQLSHVLALFLHLLCGSILYLLLRRLSWSHRLAVTAIFLFLLAPWAAQPVVWWSAVCTTVSSILMLLAVHAFVTWYPGRSSRTWLIVSQVLIFIAFLFYELWLGSFVLFWMLGFYLERRTRIAGGHRSTWSELLRRATRRSWPVILPYIFWGILLIATLTFETGIRAPHTSILRIPVTFLSIHLRVYHWFFDTPWFSGISTGWNGLLTPIGLVCLACMVIFLVIGRSLKKKWGGQLNDSLYRTPPDIMDMVLVAWGIFLGSRLVFILQGGVSTHTRHSYGAAMGFAIAASWLFWRLWDGCESRVALRRVVSAFAIVIAVVLVTTTSGLALHAAYVAKAEQYTLDLLRFELAQLPVDRNILIVGDATGTRGEMSYYQEESGWWLEYRLRHVLTGRRVYVLEDIPPRSTLARLLRSGKEEFLRLDRASVFHWRGGELKQELLVHQ